MNKMTPNFGREQADYHHFVRRLRRRMRETMLGDQDFDRLIEDLAPLVAREDKATIAFGVINALFCQVEQEVYGRNS